MQVVVEGLLAHYERSGKGRTILILPGWADTSVSWSPVQKTLSETYDVIVLDIPGFGGSQPPATAWDLNDYSAFVGRFLDKLDIKNVYALVGHSNGGAMAIRAVASSRVSVKKLVLVASAGVRSIQTGRKGIMKAVAKTGKVLSAPLPGSVKQKLRRRLYTSIGSDMLVAEHMQETFKKIISDDVQSDASRVQVPTLLIYGDKDTETPPAFGELFHQTIKGSILEIIPGADHFVHVRQPDTVATKIKEFLK